MDNGAFFVHLFAKLNNDLGADENFHVNPLRLLIRYIDAHFFHDRNRYGIYLTFFHATTTFSPA
jgi:hypothetical protein